MSTADSYRPQWHFSARQSWINDPNGLIYLDGEYHLFFQCNPFGDVWGHMSWGHAVSTDLLHWQELPIAIPETPRVSIFSGSIVLDRHNSSGFGKPGEQPLVAIYTGCKRVPDGGQAQELAYSTDRGRTWSEYPHNPVLDLGLRDFRDPKVFWHEPTARWVMAVVRPDDHVVSFYASTNLLQWQHMSDFGPAGETGGIWECPDLIHFADDGGTGAHWLLKVDTFAGHPGGTGAQVFIGDFDGVRFTPHTAPGSTGVWVDHGCDFYAALSWANLPDHHTAPLWIGWMSNHGYAARTPTTGWRGAMTVPRELFLRRSPQGPRLGQRPWQGLTELRGPVLYQGETPHVADTPWTVPTLGHTSLDIVWELDASTAAQMVMRVRSGAEHALVVGVDRVRGVVYVDRCRSGVVVDELRWSGRREAPLDNPHGPHTLRVLLDRGSIEVFTDDGSVCLTEVFYPDDADAGFELLADAEQHGRLSVWPIRACMHRD